MQVIPPDSRTLTFSQLGLPWPRGPDCTSDSTAGDKEWQQKRRGYPKYFYSSSPVTFVQFLSMLVVLSAMLMLSTVLSIILSAVEAASWKTTSKPPGGAAPSPLLEESPSPVTCKTGGAVKGKPGGGGTAAVDEDAAADVTEVAEAFCLFIISAIWVDNRSNFSSRTAW